MFIIDEKILEAECPRYFAVISHENSRKFSVMNCCLISQQRLLDEIWPCNSAFFKAKIIRECPNITKFVRGWSKGGLDSLAWQYASSGCELLNDRKDFLWYVWKEIHPKNRCSEMVPPSPFLRTRPPLP